MSEPLLLTIEEAAETLRCERTKVFELLASGDLIRAPKFGRRTVIYAESVFHLLEKGMDPPAEKPKRVRVRGPRAAFQESIDQVVANARGQG